MMVALYLMLNIFAQLPSGAASTGGVAFSSIFASISQPKDVVISFRELNGIKLGTTVVSGGYALGEVAGIEVIESDPALNTAASAAQFRVKIQLSSNGFGQTPASAGLIEHLLSNSKLIALQTMPVTAVRTKPETVIELLPIPQNERLCSHRQEDAVCGYASYEEFWSAAIPTGRKTPNGKI